VAEVALSIVLLIGAGLYDAQFLILTRVDLASIQRNVLYLELAGATPTISVERSGFHSKVRTRKNSVTRQLLDRMKAVPGCTLRAERDEEPPLKFDSRTSLFPAGPTWNVGSQTGIRQRGLF